MKYYPEIDTGDKLNSPPILLALSDQQVELKEQKCLTQDWKAIKVKTLIVYNIQRPVHYLVNVNDPIECLKSLCATTVRDVIAKSLLSKVLEDKKMIGKTILVKN